MKTLAARGLKLMDKSGMARVAAIAAPMVLFECHSNPPQMPSGNATVVNIEAQNSGKTTEQTGMDFGGRSAGGRMKPKIERERQTELNVDIYEGCVLRARLSVINPDGSLERIILDPKIDFLLEGTQATGRIVCRQAWECDISAIAGLSSHSGFQTDIRATFRPAQDSGLSASFSILPLPVADLAQYCP
ncbi:MAG: hypothetical protein V1861_01680 [Candidatus Micrarchaeota archaeon]